jgi:RNA polymerase sigma-B factor
VTCRRCGSHGASGPSLLDACGGAISVRTPHPATPSSRRDAQLLERYAQSRSPELRDQLVRRYLPLARFCANQFARGSEPFDDLLQVASIGLIKALDRYEPARGIAFSSFALPTMSGEIRRHFRDRSWTVRPPRDLQDWALATERATAALTRDLGRSPTIDEVAERAGLSAEAVLEAREALGARTAASLSAPLGSGDEHYTLADAVGAVDGGFAVVEQRATIDALTRQSLTPREREILRLRFDEDLTQSEIGAAIGLSQMHVSRVLRTALDKLRLTQGAATTLAGARDVAASRRGPRRLRSGG